jgi:iron complex transport system substrate-binding protein
MVCVLTMLGSVCIAEAKPKVASIDNCMNQYVLALADPEQILSLSRSVQNPWSSYMYKEAIAVQPHYNDRKAEELLKLQPDIVFAGYRDRVTIDMLRTTGVPVEQYTAAKSVEDVKKQIARVAKSLGQEPRGQDLIRRIDDAVHRGVSANLKKTGERPLAALYNDGGYSRGSATLVDDIMEMAGFRNLAKELGFKGGAKIPLENLVLAQPDYMIKNTTGKLARKSKRVASDIVDHPALKRAMPNGQRIIFPTVYWLCGGESTPVAIDYLIHEAQMKRLGLMKSGSN